MSDHTITINIGPPRGSIPAIFYGRCSCGETFSWNAFKWVVLDIQQHVVAAGLAKHKDGAGQGGGLIVDTIAGDGLPTSTPSDPHLTGEASGTAHGDQALVERIAWLLTHTCPTCMGPRRETVGMVCQACGTDYAPGDRAVGPDNARTDPGA